MHGLGTNTTKIKCSSNYGTPKWVLHETKKEVPRCLKPCISNQDCNDFVHNYDSRTRNPEQLLKSESKSLEQSNDGKYSTAWMKYDNEWKDFSDRMDVKNGNSSTNFTIFDGKQSHTTTERTKSINYTYSYCKSVSEGNRFCFSSSCSKRSLIRRNSRGISLPQNGNHNSDLNRLNDNLPIGHLGSLRCDPGYIFNPSELSGEISNELNVKCVEDKICGGTSWKLIDGSDVPECIEGT